MQPTRCATILYTTHRIITPGSECAHIDSTQNFNFSLRQTLVICHTRGVNYRSASLLCCVAHTQALKRIIKERKKNHVFETKCSTQRDMGSRNQLRNTTWLLRSFQLNRLVSKVDLKQEQYNFSMIKLINVERVRYATRKETAQRIVEWRHTHRQQ